jgi:fumarate reductase subunit D
MSDAARSGVSEEVRDVALFAALAYVVFFSLLIVMYKRDNDFLHFHARQGLVIFIFEVISWTLAAVLPNLSGAFAVCNLLLLIASVFGLFSALMGKMIHFPLVSRVADRLVV